MSTADSATRPDSCPGALRLHEAADGALARIRVPGGRLLPAQLRALADIAEELGDGCLELTSRGNVQLRGLGQVSAEHALAPGVEMRLAERLREAGLLPSASHDRVRNIVASPLAGLDDQGFGGVADLVGALDAAIRAEDRIAALSGRYLFALDDGRGDVASLAPDAGWLARSPQTGSLIVAGADTGLEVSRRDAVGVLIAVTLLFLGFGQAHWRIRHPDSGKLVEKVRVRFPELAARAPRQLPASTSVGTGPVYRAGRAAGRVVSAPFGRLTSGQARLAADLANGNPLVATPWRGVVIPGSASVWPPAQVRLREAGLICDPDSAWLGATACTGRPNCPKALADVRGEAADSVERSRGLGGRGGLALRHRVHWSGCERRCGRPAEPHLDVLALPEGGYAIAEGAAAPSHRVPAGAAAARVAELREQLPVSGAPASGGEE